MPSWTLAHLFLPVFPSLSVGDPDGFRQAISRLEASFLRLTSSSRLYHTPGPSWVWVLKLRRVPSGTRRRRSSSTTCARLTCSRR